MLFKIPLQVIFSTQKIGGADALRVRNVGCRLSGDRCRSWRLPSGPNESRFPGCTSLLIDDGDTVAIIDPGAGQGNLLNAIGSSKADIIINTHYHFDHISGNYLFPNAQLLINPIEADCFPNLGRIAELVGVKEIYGNDRIDDWIKRVSNPDSPQTKYSPSNRHEWWMSTRFSAGSYT